MRYPVEDFTSNELKQLQPYFTNTDRPVFALTNLPEVVKGAMYARYSRYSGSLRRMFLDEFAADVQGGERQEIDPQKAAGLYERVFVGYGDDSIAQVGGAHLACEYVSNILTKQLQRGRLAAYLEQSTRYIAYDQPLPGGGYRYYDGGFDAQYQTAMDELFTIYSDALPVVIKAMAEKYPNDNQPEKVWMNSIKAKALDLLRGLLPAASLSHVGIYASGQAYEMLLMRLLASPLPEARNYGQMMLEELQHVIPSFLSRIERPERGGKWIEYFVERREKTEALVSRFGLSSHQVSEQNVPSSVELVTVRGSEDELLTASIYEQTNLGDQEITALIKQLSVEQKAELMAAVVGERENRRHRPGRGFENVSYRFEVVSDYGAFRDLQRHRMLTCQWQSLTPDLGAEIPDELPGEVKQAYQRGLEISANEYQRQAEINPETAAYTLCLGYKIRYIMDMNAREAMQLTELRSGVEGHPSYRAVAQAMHQRISDVHPAIGAAFKFIDSTTEPRLERILSEIRTHHKQEALKNT